MPSAACGRADLLQAMHLAAGNKEQEITLAGLLNYVLQAEQTTPTSDQPHSQQDTYTPHVIETDKSQVPIVRPYHLVSVDNVISTEAWQAESSTSHETATLNEDDMGVWDASYQQPTAQPIVPWTRLWPHLRQAVAKTHARNLDMERLTEQLSRGHVLRHLPRKKRLSWPNPLTLVLDFSDRLTPYWDDWHWLRQQLEAQLNQQVKCYRLQSVPQKPLQRILNGRPEPDYVRWPTLVAGDTVLLASDLGMVDAAHSWPAECWLEKLIAYRRSGIRVIVLAPVSARHLQAALVNLAIIIRLSPDSSLRFTRRMSPIQASQTIPKPMLSEPAAMLLSMVAVATRVEPGLLRALRSTLPGAGRDIGLEAEVWCHQQMNTAATACALGEWAVQPWREKFSELAEPLQQSTLECLRMWHAQLPQAIHYEETLVWQHLAKPHISQHEKDNAQLARGFFIRLKNTLLNDAQLSTQHGVRALQTHLADRHVHWVSAALGQRELYIAELSAAVAQAEPQRAQTGLPSAVNPINWLKSLPITAMRSISLLQEQNLKLKMVQDLSARLAHSATSRLATLSLDRNAVLWAWGQGGNLSAYRPWAWQQDNLEQTPLLPPILAFSSEPQQSKNLYLHTGQQRLCFSRFDVPEWATAWGQDAYGLYAELRVDKLTQRFRWIEPGTFQMGSAETEKQRDEDESLHEVTITNGYWLADTTCTQALWMALMKDNPSKFKDNDNNPVETVSWKEVQQFIDKLNTKYPGLEARLPSEAEWEYACQAGSTTAFSFGDTITPEQVNYNGNHPYADGKKGLYRECTVEVKSLPANLWGLFEMHGNVWEWCADWFGDYPSNSMIDPIGSDNGVFRVRRGGSWGSDGWDARSAYRSRYQPANRIMFTGFRLALGRADM